MIARAPKLFLRTKSIFLRLHEVFREFPFECSFSALPIGGQKWLVSIIYVQSSDHTCLNTTSAIVCLQNVSSPSVTFIQSSSPQNPSNNGVWVIIFQRWCLSTPLSHGRSPVGAQTGSSLWAGSWRCKPAADAPSCWPPCSGASAPCEPCNHLASRAGLHPPPVKNKHHH